MTEIKKTAKSRTTPRQIRLLPQKAISWELTPNFDKLRVTYIDEKAYLNLDYWEEFENNYSDTFSTMYQFWVQKKFS